MCGLCGIVDLDRPPDARRGRPLARRARAPRTGRSRRLRRRRASASVTSASRSSTSPMPGLQPMQDRRAAAPAQRRDLQLPRAARRAAREGPLDSRPATDSEVILAAYREWGERCVERFNGMWAFVDLGRRRADAVLPRATASASSRSTTGSTATGSRSRASRGRFGAAVRISAAVRDYLEQGYLDQGDETFFAGRRPAPAGALAHLRPGRPAALAVLVARAGASRRPTRSTPCARRSSTRCASSCAATSPSARASPAASTRPSIAVAVAHHGHEHQKTVTAYFDDPGFDERPFARAVVERTGAEAHWVTFDADDLVERPAGDRRRRRTSRSARRRSAPAGTSCARRREAGLTVMLDGQGGDEILAGYRASFGYRLADLLRRGRLSRGDARACARSRTSHGPRWAAVALATPHVPERAPARSARPAARGGDARRRPSCGDACDGRGRQRRALPRPAPSAAPASCSRDAACPSCSATRIATRWRTRSRRACRCSTTGSSSSPSRSTAAS